MNLEKVIKERPELLKVNLLALVLSFEKYWQSYSLSDGVLYEKEVREEAKKIVSLFYEIYGKKKLIQKDGRINDVDMLESRQLVEELDKWLKTKDKFPKVFLGKEYTHRSQLYYQVVFIELESQLQKEIALPIGLSYTATVHETIFRRKQFPWALQLPSSLLDKVLEPSILDQMSKSDTIVVVADIRRSQDLITYGLTPEFYRKQIIGLLDEVKRIFHDCYGILDRFTGDGFIAYFNQYVCEQGGNDYYNMLLMACEKIQAFAAPYFDNWSKQIRKIPSEPIGLSLGIDSGNVDFKQIEGQIYAIGDACVWATRMCDAGKRGDIIFNNIPYHKIAPYGADGFSTEIDSVTKNGESFKAYLVKTSMVTYQPLPKKDPSLDKPTAIS